MADNLTSRTLHGLKWSYLSNAINTFLQIGFTAALARLLEPSAFGLIAMAGVILRFGSYFSAMGVGPALIQKEQVSSQDIITAFTSSLTLGLLFFGLAWFTAPFAICIFSNAELILVIRIMGLSLLLTGLSTTALSLLRRNLKFRNLAIIETISYLLGYGILGISLAKLGFGVWSLVAGTLSQNTLVVILAYLCTRHKLSLSFEWSNYKPLYSYGSRISLISFVQFLGYAVQPVVIGRYLGASALGFYNNAHKLPNLPLQSFTTSLSRVMFPSFSSIQKDIPRLERAYQSSYFFVGLVVMPIAFGMIPAAKEIVLTMLGPQWVPSIDVLRILAISAPFNCLCHLSSIVCDSTAQLKFKFRIEMFYIPIIISFVVFFLPMGILGIAVAYSLGELLKFFAYFILMKKVVGFKFIWINEVHRLVLFNTASVVASITLVHFVCTGLSITPLPMLFFDIFFGFVVLFFTIFIVKNRLIINELKNIYLRLIAKREKRNALYQVIERYAEIYLKI